MKRVIMAALLLSGCNYFRRMPATAPEVHVRVDTVTVNQTVEPPLREGRPVDICLSNGITTQVHIATNGDTLIGEGRIALSDLRPAVTFSGTYAATAEWYRRDDPVRLDGRQYRRLGVERIRVCDELKLVGEYNGVPVFAEVTAPQTLPMIVVPVRPGMYQDYIRVTR
jgi:hypothetical protein